jgi:hypothetical protein
VAWIDGFPDANLIADRSIGPCEFGSRFLHFALAHRWCAFAEIEADIGCHGGNLEIRK